MDILIGQLATGLSLGSILLLAALGLSLTFGQMGVINMAHGEFIMIGAYTPYLLQTVFFVGATSAAFWLALPVAFLIAGLVGLLLEVVLLKRLYGRPLDSLLVTFGVALILQQLARDLFGAPNVEVIAPGVLAGNITFLGVTLPKTRLFIMGLVVVVLVGVWLFQSKSRHG